MFITESNTPRREPLYENSLGNFVRKEREKGDKCFCETGTLKRTPKVLVPCLPVVFSSVLWQEFEVEGKE